MNSESLISRRAAEIGLKVDAPTVAQLTRFVDLVLEYKDRASLTSLRTSADVVEGLLVDSLALSTVEGFAEARRCLDVGVGGGFPSVPAAIVSPSNVWVGVDRARRKVAFLRSILRLLSIQRYEAICADLHQIAYTHQFASSFDLVVVRALRLNEQLLRATRSVLSPDGRVVLYRHTREDSILDVYGQFTGEAPSARTIAPQEGIRSLRFEYHDLGGLDGAIR
ncbi:MAG: class I SAM-dependent methyltransferase [Candidatus Coatesbacteria bacterium]|nr:class I SAM-dependent methyltransferase [Candidatus Coatesbacteria bacterium]